MRRASARGSAPHIHREQNVVVDRAPRQQHGGLKDDADLFARPGQRSPSMAIEPADSGTIPAIILRIVLLPQPEGPTTETNSPCGMSKDTPSSAWMGPLRVR